jgi:aerobic-type carbon monoxide dehydrogenase small subunit (CoxS/CutS family)
MQGKGWIPMATELLLNEIKVSVEAELDDNLLRVLREQTELTGAKYGCGEGQCGACTVLLDGSPVRSCVTPLRSAVGKQITTIEGLEREGQLHPVQQAFLDAEAFQCAFCTSGMIVSAAGLLRRNPNPSREQIVQVMQGNICRCGTYPRIVAAIEQAASATARRGDD